MNGFFIEKSEELRGEVVKELTRKKGLDHELLTFDEDYVYYEGKLIGEIVEEFTTKSNGINLYIYYKPL